MMAQPHLQEKNSTEQSFNWVSWSFSVHSEPLIRLSLTLSWSFFQLTASYFHPRSSMTSAAYFSLCCILCCSSTPHLRLFPSFAYYPDKQHISIYKVNWILKTFLQNEYPTFGLRLSCLRWDTETKLFLFVPGAILTFRSWGINTGHKEKKKKNQFWCLVHDIIVLYCE